MTERLTEEFKDGRNILRKGIENIHHVGFGQFYAGEAIDKLSEYETAEEDGRLVVLPSTQAYSSLGGYVYYIYDYEIVECVNCAITIDADGRTWICLDADEDIFPYREPIAEFDTDPTDWCQKAIDVLVSEWGKTVFLTREEAEKALKERVTGSDGKTV